MANYWLTFCIKDRTVGGLDDNDRREALYGAIQKIAASTWWREPTSFILFASDADIDTISRQAKNAIAPDYDLVLIRAAESKDARVIGLLEDTDLFKLMPYAKAA